MIRCSKCVMPLTRPDTPSVDGVCQACLNYKNRPTIDWEERRKQLEQLLDRHHGECIVPSSGGKDSTYQAITLKNMGANVTAVTARTCHLTAIGRANIDNLARHVRTIEVVPNMTTRGKLNRIGLEMVGDISWPEHVSIFTTPFKVANQLGIPLIFYGENPQDQYGGPVGSEQARTMTARWVQEFGGFLGLRPSDLASMTSEQSMRDYQLTITEQHAPYEAHFLGAYIPWDSHENARVAADAGMVQHPPSIANWWPHENLDNAQTGLHDHSMYRKYGYGRGCAQISVDVRAGIIARNHALDWVEEYDGAFPHLYMGIPVAQVLRQIDITEKRLWELLDYFTNKELFNPDTLGMDRPILKA